MPALTSDAKLSRAVIFLTLLSQRSWVASNSLRIGAFPLAPSFLLFVVFFIRLTARLICPVYPWTSMLFKGAPSTSRKPADPLFRMNKPGNM